MNKQELYHYGIKGMKWGVRRYQNADGTLTAAGKKRNAKQINKQLKKSFSRSGSMKDSVDAIESSVDSIVSKSQKQKIKSTRDEWLEKQGVVDKEENKVSNEITKVADRLYKNEIQKNGDSYPTERDKGKLYEYFFYDEAPDVVRKNNPQLAKAEKDADAAWDKYQAACKEVTESLLGSYGNKKYSTISGTFSAKEIVENTLRRY